MFTGIVEELGEVVEVRDLGEAARFTVRGKAVVDGARHGDSIAVNGVCLTVVDVTADTFTVDVMKISLDTSALGGLCVGTAVNLERAVRADGRLGGHIVQGHVDGTGTIVSRAPSEHWELVAVAIPAALARYVVVKGSLAIDGVSLTVAALADAPDGGAVVTVSLIPTTLGLTTLGHKGPGEQVNLEVDVIAKYIERLLDHRTQSTQSTQSTERTP
jgi:riboflavin synthase